MFDWFFTYLFGMLHPIMNRIDYNLIEATKIYQALLQHWPNMQYLALKRWSYYVELEATYASFTLTLSAYIHSTAYWEVHSDVNCRVLSATQTHPCTFLVESHDQYTFHAPSLVAS